MVPRGSNGAGQAIVDARVLADRLAQHRDDPAAALRAYEATRRPATANVVLANRSNPPDAILRVVYERTGDRPFDASTTSSRATSSSRSPTRYKRVAGYDRETLGA